MKMETIKVDNPNRLVKLARNHERNGGDSLYQFNMYTGEIKTFDWVNDAGEDYTILTSDEWPYYHGTDYIGYFFGKMFIYPDGMAVKTYIKAIERDNGKKRRELVKMIKRDGEGRIVNG